MGTQQDRLGGNHQREHAAFATSSDLRQIFGKVQRLYFVFSTQQTLYGLGPLPKWSTELYPETPDIDWVLSSNKEEIVMKYDNSKLPDLAIWSDAQSLRLLRFGTAHHCSGVVKPAAHLCDLFDDGQHQQCALVGILGTVELVNLLSRCFQDRLKFTAGRHLGF